MKCWFSRESAPLLTNQPFDAVRARLNPKKTIQRKLNDDFPFAWRSALRDIRKIAYRWLD